MRHWNRALLISLAFIITSAVGCATKKEPNAEKVNAAFAAAQLAERDCMNEEAIKQYQKALAEDPKHRDTLRALAMLYTSEAKYSDAAPLWRRYVTATDGTADAYNDLGYCQDLAGWPKEAELAYRRAIAADPRHVKARMNYGLMLARHGRGTEALCHLQCVLTPAEARYNLGLAYEQVGLVGSAQAEFRKAVQLDPNFGDAKSHIIIYDEEGTTARTE